MDLKQNEEFMLFPLKEQFELYVLDAVPYVGAPALGLGWPQLTKQGLSLTLTHKEAQRVHDWLIRNFELKRGKDALWT